MERPSTRNSSIFDKVIVDSTTNFFMKKEKTDDGSRSSPSDKVVQFSLALGRLQRNANVSGIRDLEPDDDISIITRSKNTVDCVDLTLSSDDENEVEFLPTPDLIHHVDDDSNDTIFLDNGPFQEEENVDPSDCGIDMDAIECQMEELHRSPSVVRGKGQPGQERESTAIGTDMQESSAQKRSRAEPPAGAAPVVKKPNLDDSARTSSDAVTNPTTLVTPPASGSLDTDTALNKAKTLLSIVWKTYKCPAPGCPFYSKTLFAYRQHMKGHEYGFPFGCHRCSYTSKNKLNLGKHISLHRNDISNVKNTQKYPDTFQGQGIDDLEENSLNDARISNGSVSGRVRIKGQGPLCPKCPTRHHAGLKSHLEQHGKQGLRFNCPYCDYASNRTDYMQSHIQAHLTYLRLQGQGNNDPAMVTSAATATSASGSGQDVGIAAQRTDADRDHGHSATDDAGQSDDDDTSSHNIHNNGGNNPTTTTPDGNNMVSHNIGRNDGNNVKTANGNLSRPISQGEGHNLSLDNLNGRNKYQSLVAATSPKVTTGNLGSSPRASGNLVLTGTKTNTDEGNHNPDGTVTMKYGNHQTIGVSNDNTPVTTSSNHGDETHEAFATVNHNGIGAAIYDNVSDFDDNVPVITSTWSESDRLAFWATSSRNIAQDGNPGYNQQSPLGSRGAVSQAHSFLADTSLSSSRVLTFTPLTQQVGHHLITNIKVENIMCLNGYPEVDVSSTGMLTLSGSSECGKSSFIFAVMLGLGYDLCVSRDERDGTTSVCGLNIHDAITNGKDFASIELTLSLRDYPELANVYGQSIVVTRKLTRVSSDLSSMICIKSTEPQNQTFSRPKLLYGKTLITFVRKLRLSPDRLRLLLLDSENVKYMTDNQHLWFGFLEAAAYESEGDVEEKKDEAIFLLQRLKGHENLQKQRHEWLQSRLNVYPPVDSEKIRQVALEDWKNYKKSVIQMEQFSKERKELEKNLRTYQKLTHDGISAYLRKMRKVFEKFLAQLNYKGEIIVNEDTSQLSICAWNTAYDRPHPTTIEGVNAIWKDMSTGRRRIAIIGLYLAFWEISSYLPILAVDGFSCTEAEFHVPPAGFPVLLDVLRRKCSGQSQCFISSPSGS